MRTMQDRDKLDRYAEDCARSIGARLRAVYLYGDAATDAAAQPLTTLLVVDQATPDLLGQAGALRKRWSRRGFATPLLLDDEYLATSCDVFPLEFLALKEQHLLLRGERDLLAELPIGLEHLRLEVEQQLKGKVLHLRQSFVEAAGDLRSLGSLMVGSSAGFETIMRGLLLLADAPRGEAAEICERVETMLGVDLSTFRRIRRSRHDGSVDGDAAQLFESYLAELTALARKADRVTRP